MEHHKEIRSVVRRFPAEFGLRAFPGERFRINLSDCYVSQGKVILYAAVRRGERWEAFCKGDVEEILREVVPISLLTRAQELHQSKPGTWIRTDADVTQILETVAAEEHPIGGIWWRTHHLVRHLGGVV